MSDTERAAYWNRIDSERREAALYRAICATPLKTLGALPGRQDKSAGAILKVPAFRGKKAPNPFDLG